MNIDAGERRVMIEVPEEKAPAMRRLVVTLDRIAAARGQPTADAVLRAADEGLAAGLFDGRVPDAELSAWLDARVQAILDDAR